MITYEINEWFRFDRPGKYRLYLTSPRVSRIGKREEADAEEALWRRFDKWHREWNGREQELKVDFLEDNPIRLQTGLEQALRMALSNSPAWLADLKKLERLKRLCVTQNERQQVDHLIQEWSGEIQIRFAPAESDWGHINVAHYDLNSLSALKKKLAQFPKGAVFKWQPYNEGHLDEEKEKLFRITQRRAPTSCAGFSLLRLRSSNWSAASRSSLNPMRAISAGSTVT